MATLDLVGSSDTSGSRVDADVTIRCPGLGPFPQANRVTGFRYAYSGTGFTGSSAYSYKTVSSTAANDVTTTTVLGSASVLAGGSVTLAITSGTWDKTNPGGTFVTSGGESVSDTAVVPAVPAPGNPGLGKTKVTNQAKYDLTVTGTGNRKRLYASVNGGAYALVASLDTTATLSYTYTIPAGAASVTMRAQQWNDNGQGTSTVGQTDSALAKVAPAAPATPGLSVTKRADQTVWDVTLTGSATHKRLEAQVNGGAWTTVGTQSGNTGSYVTTYTLPAGANSVNLRAVAWNDYNDWDGASATATSASSALAKVAPATPAAPTMSVSKVGTTAAWDVVITGTGNQKRLIAVEDGVERAVGTQAGTGTYSLRYTLPAGVDALTLRGEHWNNYNTWDGDSGVTTKSQAIAKVVPATPAQPGLTVTKTTNEAKWTVVGSGTGNYKRLYASTDGGTTWTQIAAADNSTADLSVVYTAAGGVTQVMFRASQWLYYNAFDGASGTAVRDVSAPPVPPAAPATPGLTVAQVGTTATWDLTATGAGNRKRLYAIEDGVQRLLTSASGTGNLTHQYTVPGPLATLSFKAEQYDEFNAYDGPSQVSARTTAVSKSTPAPPAAPTVQTTAVSGTNTDVSVTGAGNRKRIVAVEDGVERELATGTSTGALNVTYVKPPTVTAVTIRGEQATYADDWNGISAYTTASVTLPRAAVGWGLRL